MVARVRLWHVLLLALALRLVALAVPSVAHPDEVFQYLEAAHRMVFGYGVTPWEWRVGMRGGLIPLLVAAPMALGDRIAPAGPAYLILPKLLMVAIALAPVAAAWALGRRLSRLHAVAAAGGIAIWYEGIYYAPHVLSETLSLAAILPAAALLLDRDRPDARRLVAAGALLGLAATLRFQHVPAIVVLALAATGWRPGRAWVPLAAGALAGLVPAAVADAAIGQVPLVWVAENVRQNLVFGKAAQFGTSSVWGFAADNAARWALWIVPALVLAARGARRYPALAWCAAANLAVHMALSHKEYRFVLLSTTLLVVLAAIGTVDHVRAVARRRGAAVARRRLALVTVAWLIASAGLALGGFRLQWSAERPQLDLAIAERRDPVLCGIALVEDYSTTGAYAYLHRRVPMLYVDAPDVGAALRRDAGAANTIMAAPAHAALLPPGYAPLRCAGAGATRMCLYRRPGRCDPRPSPDAIDRSLARIAL